MSHFGKIFGLFTALVAVGCGNSDSDSKSNWAGSTYLVQIQQYDWAEPRAITSDPFVNQIVPDFLLGVEAGAGDELKVTLATAEGAQDLCNQTTLVSTTRASYPDVQIAAPQFPMRMTNPDANITVRTTIRNLRFTNVLPGGDEKRGELSAEVDVREVYPLFTLIPNAMPDSVCASLGQVGAPCAACSADSKPYCLTLRAIGLGAQRQSQPVRTVAPADIGSSCSP